MLSPWFFPHLFPHKQSFSKISSLIFSQKVFYIIISQISYVHRVFSMIFSQVSYVSHKFPRFPPENLHSSVPNFQPKQKRPVIDASGWNKLCVDCVDMIWWCLTWKRHFKLWFPSPNCSPQIRRAEPRDSIATAAWKAWDHMSMFLGLVWRLKSCWHQKIIGFSDVHGFFGNLEIQNLTAFGTLDVVGLEDGLMVLICVNFT
jgi:hypothetical protein